MSKFSVKKPYTVIVGVVMVILLGIISFTKTTTDLLPEMELPYVVVYTTYPGASAEKVESNVTKVLESSLSTTENLLNTTSVSSDNLSLVVLEFAEDTNMDTVKIDLNTKINQASAYLEDGVGTPLMMAINPNMLPIMVATVDYNGKDLLELSEFVTKNVENELLKSGGVADVAVDGLLKETIQVSFDQSKIDDINNRILNSVNTELAKAEKEINDGLKEINDGLAKINDGEKELSDKKNDTFDSLASSGIALNEAASQLIAMDNQIIELNAQKSAYTKIIESLNPVIVEAKKLYNLNDEADINLLIDKINVNIEILRDIIDGFEEENVDRFVKGIVDNPLVDQEIKDSISNITNNEELVKYLKDNLDKLNGILDKLLKLQEAIISYNDASIRLPQLDVEISTAEVVKKSAIDILNKAGIDTSDLKSLQAKLESGKLIATNEITKGEITLSSTKAKLEATKKELESAKEKLEESKKEALKSANIDSLLTSDMLSNILMAENFNMPAGYLKGDNSLLIKVGDKFNSLDELSNLLLVSMDIKGLEAIKLSDVASVTINDNSSELYTKVNGNDAVILTIQKTSTASTSEVSKNIKKSFDSLENEFEGLNFETLMDQGIYIDIIIDSVLDNFIVGGILAIIVLIIFLRNFKTTLIIALSIPISFMFAMVMMYFSGISLNIISLSGLALGVGMLVDNSVVVVENIYRLKSEGQDIKEAAIDGAKQVSTAIFASTLTTICVFLPIIFTEGLTRQLFTDMALTISYSLIASLIVALTLVPTLSSLLLKKTKTQEHKFYNKMVNVYEKTLKWALSHRLIVLLVVLVLLVVSFVSVKNVGMELMPSMDSYQMSLMVETSNEMDDDTRYQLYDDVMMKVKSLDEIEAIGVSENNGMVSKDDEVVNTTFYIVANQDADINALKELIPNSLKDIDAKVSLSTSQMDMSSLGSSGISMKLYGDDLDKLKDAAQTIEDQLMTIEGIKEVDNGLDEAMNELNVIIDKNKAMEYGLTIAQVYGEVANKLKTETSSVNLSFEDKEYPLVIIKENIRDINDLYNMTLKGKKNNETVDITLDDIATFEDGKAMSAINRDNGRRHLNVSASLEDGYNVALVSRDVKKAITSDMISGIEIEFDGENETIIDAMIELIKMILLAIAFIYMIMVAQFQSLKYPFIVMFTIPLAFTGGLIAIELSGLNLSVVSMLGFLVLSGIVVNNGIVLIDYVNQLRENGLSNYESLIIAGKTRLRPILMTALTTILAMTSMALGIGSGSQMMQGMAIVTIGGLTYATVLTIYVVPILMSLMDKKEKNNG